jgi:hypothetical protein
LSVPINRVALTDGAVNAQRLYPSNNEINYLANIGTSDYHSLQVTLSRQAGRFQYLLAYTFAKGLGTVGNDFDPIDPLDPENRSYGVLPIARTARTSRGVRSWVTPPVAVSVQPC